MSSVRLGFINELIIRPKFRRGLRKMSSSEVNFYLGTASSHIFISLLDVISIVFGASKFL